MKRVTLTAALGAALLLGGCSSTSGTATTTKSVPSSAAVSVVPADGSSASAIALSAVSSAGSSAPQSSGGVTASAGVGTSAGKATTTVGDPKTPLDQASTVWLSAFCGGFGPVVGLAQEAGPSLGVPRTDLPKAQTALVNLYQAFGQAFIDTASKLQALAPPTFDGGPAFAAKVVTALQTSGPVFIANAAKLKAIDVSKDPLAFKTALSGLGASMTTAMAPLQDIGELKSTPQTQAAFEALPACAKLKTTAGG